ncbi:methionine aminopeptidase, type I [Gleimia coleocanis DSM 15436]|uniref:Methionine aminopeptidase n=1 Tax=Gleimia coleocanis DSM 15436 TaxID=525245 RepID=C0VZ31_9ACTO|nr:type I methionyl aminopeptidase [Gleimia coleocanis]EEH64684.1 methionine aminopeptidase, type I [Gleimia coleocanis DSM 15436]
MARIELKTPQQLRYMREAGLVVAAMHKALREAAQPGVTLLELDKVSAATIKAHGAKSNFLGYHGFPATVCISVNEVVVHGIPTSQKLELGDLVTFDCGAYVEREGQQWHADAAFTMIVGGDEHGSDEARLLNEFTHEAMWAAVASLHDGKRVSCVGDAVEATLADYRDRGFTGDIVEEYTGHGIGTRMHMEPEVINYSARGLQPRLKPGMVLAVEPIISAGGADTDILEDEWTVVTTDGSLAAQWEHTVAITTRGIWVLTAPDGGVAGLAPFGIKPTPLS